MDKPEWAKALIVAELEHDACDHMTDYYNTTTSRIVALAWSRHNRDLFAEMRQAAATFPETAHLGPGCDVWTARVVLAMDINWTGQAYYKGGPSHWHQELYPTIGGNAPTFKTEAEAQAYADSKGEPMTIEFDGQPVTFKWELQRESIEHREKYSMGAGYYLKGSSRYTSGWKVRKVMPEWQTWGKKELELGPALSGQPAPTPQATEAAPVVGGVTLRPGKRPGYVEVVFPAKPEREVLDGLKAAGFRWAPSNACWYGLETRLPATLKEA